MCSIDYSFSDDEQSIPSLSDEDKKEVENTIRIVDKLVFPSTTSVSTRLEQLLYYSSTLSATRPKSPISAHKDLEIVCNAIEDVIKPEDSASNITTNRQDETQPVNLVNPQQNPTQAKSQSCKRATGILEISSYKLISCEYFCMPGKTPTFAHLDDRIRVMLVIWLAQYMVLYE